MDTQIVVSNQTNPYWNIAVEQYLVEHVDVVTLYLWRNHRTVVIGQNQNPYSEVNLEALAADGGYLMRRRTGGGAVYHDDGNINFSFVVPKSLYDQQRQFSVVQRAVESFGLKTVLSGRNDILVDSGTSLDDDNSGQLLPTANSPLSTYRKFSGNAFSRGQKCDLHHGTLLINGDMEALGHYLRPNVAKLQRHGVQSVRSRVVNLHTLCPEITVESIVPRLTAAFEAEYSGNLEQTDFSEIIERQEVRALYDQLASDEWLYGCWKTFTATRSGHFDWGSAEVQLTVEDNTITDVQIASDALDVAALDEARRLLTGASTAQLPSAKDGIIQDIINLLSE